MNTQLIRPSRPTQTVNFATIRPLFRRVEENALVPSRPFSPDLRLAKLGEFKLDPAQLALSRVAPKAQIEQLESREFSIPTVSGVISRAAGTADIQTLGVTHLDLPFGMPRHVNVATLKKMLKAKRSELMLKRVGDRWEVCENSMIVDLTDDSVEFRLGLIQIFS